MRRPPAQLPRKAGSTLMVTLVTLAALSMMAAYTLRRVMPGMAMAHQNVAWQEARVAAEAGVDIAMNDLLINATGFQPGAWTGWQEAPVDPKNKDAPSLLKPVLQPLLGTVNKVLSGLLGGLLGGGSSGPAPVGEPVVASRSIYLDNVRISATKGLPAEVDIQLWSLTPTSTPNTRWFRIRSMATCPLPPTARMAQGGADSALRRFSLRTVRPSLQKDDVGNRTTIPLPNISRTVEVLVEPILSFELALWTGERIVLPTTGTWCIDSFDSNSTSKSGPDGTYPGRTSRALQANGYVASSAPPNPQAPYTPAILANGTRIRGAVATDGGDDPATKERENVSGAGNIDAARIHDDFSRPMIPLARPTGEFSKPPADGVYLTGPESAPTIYSVHGNVQRLSIPAPRTGTGAVVIMIDGNLDLNDPLIIPPSVIAVLYVRGDITFRGQVNAGAQSSNRAHQLLIFGDRAEPARQTMRVMGRIGVCAAFYGPNTDIVLDGNVNWTGSLNGRSFRVSSNGDGGIHYDEALASVGPTIGFRIARYIEDVRE